MSRNQRGDTIIEVILAGAILSLVTVSSFAIMQRASSSAYDALERSIVRLQINGQIELINYFRDEYIDAQINNYPVAGTPAEVWPVMAAVTPSPAPALTTCAAPVGSFYINRTTAGTIKYQIVTSGIVAATGLPEPGKGTWISRVDPTSGAPKKKYQEFYVVSCWPTTTAGEHRMSSVVRLYDPIP